jgi:hypothetical protein
LMMIQAARPRRSYRMSSKAGCSAMSLLLRCLVHPAVASAASGFNPDIATLQPSSARRRTVADQAKVNTLAYNTQQS